MITAGGRRQAASAGAARTGSLGARPWIIWGQGAAGPGVGAREGTAVPETDIGPEDPAATMAAVPCGPAAQPPARPAAQPAAWRRWSGWPVVAVPAVTSLVVGGYEIGGPSLWRDEAYTRDAITRPVGQIFALLGHQDAVHG